MRFSTAITSLLLYATFVVATPSTEDQIAMNPGSGQPEYIPQTTPQPTLADLLTIETSASIFYSYARELEMSSLLSSTSAKFTVFAPTNKAVMALARKPYVRLTAVSRLRSSCLIVLLLTFTGMRDRS